MVFPAQLARLEGFPVNPALNDEQLLQLAQRNQQPANPRHAVDGLVELGMAATAGMLISAEVLKTMQRPWFEFGGVGGGATRPRTSGSA